jgi:branched-subunit amino acid transport protein
MEIWIAIVGGGIATFATRALPLVVDLRLPERGRMRQYLDDLPTSIIAALAGAAIFAPEQRIALGAEIPAALVVIGVARWRRNLLLAVLAGVTTIALLRTILT